MSLEPSGISEVAPPLLPSSRSQFLGHLHALPPPLRPMAPLSFDRALPSQDFEEAASLAFKIGNPIRSLNRLPNLRETRGSKRKLQQLNSNAWQTRSQLQREERSEARSRHHLSRSRNHSEDIEELLLLRRKDLGLIIQLSGALILSLLNSKRVSRNLEEIPVKF